MKRQRQIAAFGGALLIALIGLAGYLLTVWLLTARPLPPRPPAASGQIGRAHV